MQKEKYETATCLALCQYSMCSTFKNMLFNAMGISPGAFLITASRKKTLQRVRKTERLVIYLLERD